MIKVAIKGADQVAAAFGKKGAAIDRAVMRGAFRGALLVQRRILMAIMKGPKTGNIYGKHQASRAGEAPANDLGNLAKSVSVVKLSDDGDTATVAVQVAADYAIPLEFGTRNMEPRPFVMPAMNASREEISAMIAEEVAKAVQ